MLHLIEKVVKGLESRVGRERLFEDMYHKKDVCTWHIQAVNKY